MNRRELLAGACPALAPFAGCLAGGPPAGDTADGTDEPPIPGSPSDYPVNSGGVDEFSPEETYEEVAVGSREGVADEYTPHGVVVWNDAAAPAVGLRIVDVGDGAVVYDETHGIPDGDALSVSLLEPAVYLVEVRVPAIETRHTVRVPCDFFDCNTSSTRIGIYEDGRIRSSVVSTLAGCPAPEC